MQWDWDERGEEVTRALRACDVYRRGPKHDEAVARFQAALDAAWPPGFVEQLERCRRGDPAGLDDVLDFLEAKPRFFRSGYVREKALRFLPRVPRTDAQANRLRELVLGAVDLHHRGSIRRFCSLARAVDAPLLREALQHRRQHASEQVRARARCVLDALGVAPWDRELARARREEQRIGSMVVTVKKRRSAPLARRVLGIDPAPLTSRARHYLAAVFEFAMNWGLLPDEELLAIARRLDGPEMVDIWRYALARQDAPGDRARWLLAQLGRPAIGRV